MADTDNNWLHLKPYGYAPGDYTSKCYSCQELKYDLDKRATRCKSCAEEAFKKDITDEEILEVARKWSNTKFVSEAERFIIDFGRGMIELIRSRG